MAVRDKSCGGTVERGHSKRCLTRVANKSGKLGSQEKSGNFSGSGKVREIQKISGIEKKFHTKT